MMEKVDFKPNVGFLVVKKFGVLYREYSWPADSDQVVYAIPRKGIGPEVYPKKYRGIDREPLYAYSRSEEWVPKEWVALDVLAKLEEEGKAGEDFIFDLDDAKKIFPALQKPDDYEIVWAKNELSNDPVPAKSLLLGYEPTWFWGDHFSAIADCMCFPKWHGTDDEGKLFMPYFERLNEYALFESPAVAKDFLDFYLSQGWTETGDYFIAEVRLLAE